MRLFRLGFGIVLVAALALTGCSLRLLGDGSVSLNEGCAELNATTAEVLESLALIDARSGLGAARVHLDAAEESLDRVRGVDGPEELIGLRDELVVSMEALLRESRLVMSGADNRDLGEAGAKAQQVGLKLDRMCG